MTNKKDRYIYPAIFDYSDDGISVEFPDLPGCLTCADTTEEALSNAKEALELTMYSIEEDNEEIPEPTPIQDIKTEPNQVLVMIDVWMPLVRESIEGHSVNKTLTIPKRLNKLIKTSKINCSQVVQKRLIQIFELPNKK